MPKDKTVNHEKIVAAAFNEFSIYGYENASMRRIAAACGMSVSGLYKHFSCKEEMYLHLVKPALDGLLNLYHEFEKEYFDSIASGDKVYTSSSKGELVRTIEYIYDHLKEFNLIINKSRGSVYGNFIHDIANLEEEVTLRYMDELRNKGIKIRDINRKEFHLIVASSVEMLFQTVTHGFTKDEAMHFVSTLEAFYAPAWENYFGI